MRLGISLPQGCDREYIGLSPGAGVATDGRDRPALRGGRLRIALDQRPLPGRPAGGRGTHLRVLRRAGRPGAGDASRSTRSSRARGRLPQPGPHRQGHLEHRRHQRRSRRAGHRGRLEGGRVGRLRLRLSRREDAPGHPPRCARGHQPDAGSGTRHVPRPVCPRHRRGARAQGSARSGAHPHRRQRAQRDVAACGPLRRRAQPRRA